MLSDDHRIMLTVSDPALIAAGESGRSPVPMQGKR
jgi:hypothetical protein